MAAPNRSNPVNAGQALAPTPTAADRFHGYTPADFAAVIDKRLPDLGQHCRRLRLSGEGFDHAEAAVRTVFGKPGDDPDMLAAIMAGARHIYDRATIEMVEAAGFEMLSRAQDMRVMAQEAQVAA